MVKERRRSPNHPRIGIQEAIELVRALSEQDTGGAGLSDQSVAEAWNTTTTSRLFHAGVTGLRQYGLISTEETGHHTLTETGRTVLDETTSRYVEAVRAAALYPDSLRMARNAMVHIPLTRKELVAFLQSKGFTDEAAERVVNIVTSNQKFLGIIDGDSRKPEPGRVLGEVVSPRITESKQGEGTASALESNEHPHTPKRSISEGFGPSDVIERRPGTYSYPLSRNRTVRLLFSGGEPDQRDLALLIRYLQILNDSLEESELGDVPF